jgi:hypothetical protein
VARPRRAKLMNLTEFDSIQTEAEFLVASFQQRYGFPLAPPVPVEIIANALCGLRREFRRIGHVDNETLGALWADGGVIFVDDRCTHRQRYLFTVAHEIGHWVLHEGNGARHFDLSKPVPLSHVLGSRSARTKKERARLREVEANKFAAALLMPRSFLLKEAEKHDIIDQAAIAQLARSFDVSLSAMLKRIKDLQKHLEWTGPRLEWDVLYRLEETLNRPAPGGNRSSCTRHGASLLGEDDVPGLRLGEQSQGGAPRAKKPEAVQTQFWLGPFSKDEFSVELSGSAQVSSSKHDGPRCAGDDLTQQLVKVAVNLAKALREHRRSQAGDSENGRKTPLVYEFTGTPNSGKDTLVEVVKDYLEDRHGYRVRVFDEPTKFCHIGRQLDADRLFKTVAQTVAQLYEARFENPGAYDFVIFNRGLFDRIAFLRAMSTLGVISGEQERIHRDYLLSYTTLQDAAFLFLISEEESIRREEANARGSVQELCARRDGKSGQMLRAQSIVQRDTLKHLNESYLTMYGTCKESFNNCIYLFDFTQGTDASVVDKACAVVDATLPRGSSPLPLPELFGLYYASRKLPTDGDRAQRPGANRRPCLEADQPLLFRRPRTYSGWVWAVPDQSVCTCGTAAAMVVGRPVECTDGVMRACAPAKHDSGSGVEPHAQVRL